MKLQTYKEFTEYVKARGVLAFYGKFLEGFPKLEDFTLEEQWHTGDPETDPWQWKDRAAAEKELAFGCVLGGAKGFLSRECYPLFYAACRPRYTVEEQYSLGTASPELLAVSRLFEQGRILSTSEIRGSMNVRKKAGVSKVDRAVVTLQRDYYITVCGNRRKVGKDGQAYGWPANTYCRVEDWLPDWIQGWEQTGKEQAREEILAHCDAWGLGFDLKKLEKQLFGKTK